ncbi:HalOD1 output domain-containing protein, partial [Natronococcus roseus]
MLEEKCVSQTVVEAVAEAEGVRPVELTPPLYDVIDP